MPRCNNALNDFLRFGTEDLPADGLLAIVQRRIDQFREESIRQYYDVGAGDVDDRVQSDLRALRSTVRREIRRRRDAQIRGRQSDLLERISDLLDDAIR